MGGGTRGLYPPARGAARSAQNGSHHTFRGNPLLVAATPSFKPPTDHSGSGTDRPLTAVLDPVAAPIRNAYEIRGNPLLSRNDRNDERTVYVSTAQALTKQAPPTDQTHSRSPVVFPTAGTAAAALTRYTPFLHERRC